MDLKRFEDIEIKEFECSHGEKVVIFRYIGEGDPYKELSNVIQTYTEDKPMHQFIEQTGDNPWVRILATELNNIRFEKYHNFKKFFTKENFLIHLNYPEIPLTSVYKYKDDKFVIVDWVDNKEDDILSNIDDVELVYIVTKENLLKFIENKLSKKEFIQSAVNQKYFEYCYKESEIINEYKNFSEIPSEYFPENEVFYNIEDMVYDSEKQKEDFLCLIGFKAVDIWRNFQETYSKMGSLEEKLDYILNFLDKLEFTSLGRNNNKYFLGKMLTFFADKKYHLSEIKIVLVATKYLPENLELKSYRNKLVDFYNKIKKEKT